MVLSQSEKLKQLKGEEKCKSIFKLHVMLDVSVRFHSRQTARGARNFSFPFFLSLFLLLLWTTQTAQTVLSKQVLAAAKTANVSRLSRLKYSEFRSSNVKKVFFLYAAIYVLFPVQGFSKIILNYWGLTLKLKKKKYIHSTYRNCLSGSVIDMQREIKSTRRRTVTWRGWGCMKRHQQAENRACSFFF